MDGSHLPTGLGKRLGVAAAIAAPVAAALAAAERHQDTKSRHGGTTTGGAALRDERSRIAHLLRRAGFGASRLELDAAVARGFDATLDRMLEPQDERDAADDLVSQINVPNRRLDEAQRWWLVRMRYTSRPLVEKMALFWHGHFTTSIAKVSNGNMQLMRQLIQSFRTQGMGNFRDLLLNVSKDSTMSIWLDGRFNHKDAPNENYGRELQELFTLGIGNYTEADVKAAARAFTGWTFGNNHEFVFDARDHDDGPKTFLGRTGNFNGDDIVDILAGHPATANHLATKLVRFFVSDPPDDNLVNNLAQTYLSSGYDMRSVLRALFKSDAFSSPNAYHALIKSPAEFVAGTLRTLDIQTDGTPLPPIMAALGQELFNPPNVAGWPGGTAWIATNTMLARNNMANSIAAATATDSGWSTDFKRAFGLPATPTGSELVSAVVNHLAGGDVTPGERDRLYQYLGVRPSDRVNLDRDELKLRGLVYLTLTLPVYQLN
ncbi:MAG TPA: DUF1800 domain-containing protein [Dehalococcoidia bacterium]|nr:DUF1800 domain-containing protein [Dehalococcoidia bacterium]